ncbi:MAG: fatty acid desaturase [Pseudomonadota bacterium]
MAQSKETLKDRTAKEWARIVAKYRSPSHTRSILEIIITAVPLIGLWFAAVYSYYYSYWLSLVFIVPAAFFLVRLFAIQHDCGHGTLFRHKAMNDWVGRVLGVFTWTPYDLWRRDHAAHHSTSGNLSQRGYGDITTLTMEEYQNLNFWGKFYYRFYRAPIVLFGIGPTYLFIIRQRLPFGRFNEFRAWLSAMTTNVFIAGLVVLLLYTIGVGAFFLVHLPIVILAGTVGVWLFYVQHQFEDTHWTKEANWDHQSAALYGSSHYDLPFVLRWLTANIGFHHIHHLHSKIPYYRFPKIVKDHPQLGAMSRLTLWESFKCANLHLWDEANEKLISFRERRRRLRQQ